MEQNIGVFPLQVVYDKIWWFVDEVGDEDEHEKEDQ